MSYCFVCLFRADVATSGLALRVPLLWLELASSGEDVILVINKSLYNKTLSNLPSNLSNKVYIIPEPVDFKISSLISVPPLITYLLAKKNVSKFHLSVGGAYFIDFLRMVAMLLSKDIEIHTSIGSKSLDMIVDGNYDSRYYKLHTNLMSKSDKIDCLYSPSGFPKFKHKCIQSPGSFSWKYSKSYIENLDLNNDKSNDIVFCGTLIPQKNFRLAIDAYKVLIDRYTDNGCIQPLPNFILVAPYIPEDLKTEIEIFNKSSKGKITFENYDDLDNILKSSYIFLSLQDYDNYPSQSLLEAMIFGCSIIATNQGETDRLVKTEFGNIIIEKDTEELVAAIVSLVRAPRTTNFSNIEFIRKNHSIEAYSEYFKKEFLN